MADNAFKMDTRSEALRGTKDKTHTKRGEAELGKLRNNVGPSHEEHVFQTTQREILHSVPTALKVHVRPVACMAVEEARNSSYTSKTVGSTETSKQRDQHARGLRAQAT